MFSLVLAAGLFYINEPAVFMRESPADDAKVASQTVFAEKIEVKERKGDWFSIVTPDGYEGWVHTASVIETKEPYAPTAKVTRPSAHVYDHKDTEWGPFKTLPYGAKVRIVDNSDNRWVLINLIDGTPCYIQQGDIAPEPALKTKTDLVEYSKKFIGLPYTWGGRCGFGFDCSGFIQMLYSQIGINLQRDSKNQVLDERFITVELEKAEPGDLVFFGRATGRVSHVGMYIGNNEFIHASTAPYERQPWLHISSFSRPEWSGTGEILPLRVFRQLKK